MKNVKNIDFNHVLTSFLNENTQNDVFKEFLSQLWFKAAEINVKTLSVALKDLPLKELSDLDMILSSLFGFIKDYKGDSKLREVRLIGDERVLKYFGEVFEKYKRSLTIEEIPSKKSFEEIKENIAIIGKNEELLENPEIIDNIKEKNENIIIKNEEIIESSMEKKGNNSISKNENEDISLIKENNDNIPIIKENENNEEISKLSLI